MSLLFGRKMNITAVIKLVNHIDINTIVTQPPPQALRFSHRRAVEASAKRE